MSTMDAEKVTAQKVVSDCSNISQGKSNEDQKAPDGGNIIDVKFAPEREQQHQQTEQVSSKGEIYCLFKEQHGAILKVFGSVLCSVSGWVQISHTF